jgi:DNA-directed RNA polymerase specialized sigma24 family protein
MTDSNPLAEAASLARGLVAGDAALFPRLIEKLWDPCLAMIAKSRTMRGLRAGEDEVREVATRVMTRLGRDDHRALFLYPPWQENHPDKSFDDWFRILVSNVVRDFAREQRGSDRDRHDGEPSPKRLLNQFAGTLPLDELGARPAMTDAQTAQQLLLFAKQHLPHDQLSALERWLEGGSYDDIAAAGSSDADGARKLVRAAVATLRRHFSG